jgi:hypothetical protein
MPNSLIKTELPEYKRANLKVFLVSPVEVGQKYNVVWTGMGNYLTHEFIPSKPYCEIWLNSDCKFDRDLIKLSLYRQLIIIRHILKGLEYEDAYNQADKAELKARKSGYDLDKFIKEELDKDYIVNREPSVYNRAKNYIYDTGKLHHSFEAKRRSKALVRKEKDSQMLRKIN